MQRFLTAALTFLLAASSAPAQFYDANRDQLKHLRAKRPFGVQWVEAAPNLKRLLDPAFRKELVRKCKEAKIKAIAVGVNTVTGEWLIPNKIAPVATEWEGTSLLPPTDYLQALIDEAKPQGVEVHAVVKVFAGGDKKLKRGIVYKEHPEWATVVFDATEQQQALIRPSVEFADGKVASDAVAYLNVDLTKVQNFGVDIVDDLLQNHPALDGLVLEEVRHDGVFTDFSENSQKLFSSWLEKEYRGDKVKNWPADVMEVRRVGEMRMNQPGPLYQKWIHWRAQRLREWVFRLVEIIRRKRGELIVGISVPSGYARVEGDGGNWASEHYEAPVAWAAKTYFTTGYAQFADCMMVDCFAAAVEGPGDTVEGRVKETVEAVQNVTELYPGINVSLYKGKPDEYRKALMKAMMGSKAEGLKLYDLAAIEEYGWWRITAEILGGNKEAFPEVK